MGRKVYIKAICEFRNGDPEPDYRNILSPIASRRMGKMLKQAIWTSVEALSVAGLKNVDAIMTATDHGCILNTEQYMSALYGVSEAALSPTSFMQSTHNTVSSMIAIHLGCHGYNATYSHRVSGGQASTIPMGSFESALLDAYMQIALGDIDNALVGCFDETTPDLEAAFPGVVVSRAVSMVLGCEGTEELTPENLRDLCGN